MFLINAPRVIITANFYAFVYKFRVLCYLCTIKQGRKVHLNKGNFLSKKREYLRLKVI